MPRTALRTLAAALAPALAACSDALAPALPDGGPPSAFRVNFGAWTWGSIDVTLRGDTLVVVRRPDWLPAQPPSTYRVVPGAGDWRAFWDAMDAAGVRGWPARCANPDVQDGGGFELEIVYGRGARIASSGSNAYPRRDGRCSDGGSAEYDAFVAAMGRLLGRAFPGA